MRVESFYVYFVLVSKSAYTRRGLAKQKHHEKSFEVSELNARLAQ